MAKTDELNLIIQTVLAELARAEHRYPVWPSQGHRGDHVWAASILAEEAGEVVKAANNYAMHGRGGISHIHSETVQTAAMAIRLLLHMDDVEKRRINESARQDLQEEHNIYPQQTEGLTYANSSTEMEAWQRQQGYRLTDYTKGMME